MKAKSPRKANQRNAADKEISSRMDQDRFKV
jgi:hypothetical protein